MMTTKSRVRTLGKNTVFMGIKDNSVYKHTPSLLSSFSRKYL